LPKEPLRSWSHTEDLGLSEERLPHLEQGEQRGNGQRSSPTELHPTELHLRTAIEQSPLATAILDPYGGYLLVNSAWKELWAPGVGGPS
jgi:PAS domain-containing protein